MKEILIFGSEGHARIVLSEIIQIKGYRVIGFVDELKKKRNNYWKLQKQKIQSGGQYKRDK